MLNLRKRPRPAANVLVHSRTILCTRDGQRVVLPRVTEETFCMFPNGLGGRLNARGVEAWHAGETVTLDHLTRPIIWLPFRPSYAEWRITSAEC